MLQSLCSLLTTFLTYVSLAHPGNKKALKIVSKLFQFLFHGFSRSK